MSETCKIPEQKPDQLNMVNEVFLDSGTGVANTQITQELSDFLADLDREFSIVGLRHEIGSLTLGIVIRSKR